MSAAPTFTPPPGKCDVDLFGQPVRKFDTALQRYGVWPTTVWPLDPLDIYTRELKREIGDDGTARGGDGQSWKIDPAALAKARRRRRPDDDRVWKASVGGPGENLYRVGAGYQSIFNPAVAAWVLNLWAPESGICADPFAGGGTRAALAAARGLTYRGCELRPEECEAVQGRLGVLGIPSSSAMLMCGDARNFADIWNEEQIPPADFLFTCPPYYDLEQYNGGAQDLSMAATYGDFLAGIAQVVEQCRRILRPGALAVWVVGLHRCPRTRELFPLNHDIAQIHREGGFAFREEVILFHNANYALRRAGQFEKGARLLVRQHEYALVFARR